MDLPAWWNSLVLVGATKLMDSHRLAMQPAAGPPAKAGLAVVCQPKHPTFCFLFLWRELLSQLCACAFGGRAEGVQQGYFSACPVNCTSPPVCGGSGRKVLLRKQTRQPNLSTASSSSSFSQQQSWTPSTAGRVGAGRWQWDAATPGLVGRPLSRGARGSLGSLAQAQGMQAYGWSVVLGHGAREAGRAPAETQLKVCDW